LNTISKHKAKFLKMLTEEQKQVKAAHMVADHHLPPETSLPTSHRRI
jgi:hypothetical protein